MQSLRAGITAEEAIGSHISEIRSLLGLSARIGRDPLLVQASTGNTSLKSNGTLWIKASGKWLANADQEEMLVPVSLPECLECMKEEKPLAGCTRGSDGEHLRPSIETYMHAVLPQRFVLHVHCIDALAWAVRSDATSRLAERLGGLRWKWIPYVPSGLPLAREVQRASSSHPRTEVFILGNHGLVVCAETCEGAESLLCEVRRRLAIPPRPAAGPDVRSLERIVRVSSWRLPELETLHALGTDVVAKRIMNGGVLYPCQAMFLGRSMPLAQFSRSLAELRARIDQVDGSCPLLVVEGCGVLIRNRITAAERGVLHGFAEVVRRIDGSAPIRYLTNYEVDSVMSADGYNYRMAAEMAGLASSAGQAERGGWDAGKESRKIAAN